MMPRAPNRQRRHATQEVYFQDDTKVTDTTIQSDPDRLKLITITPNANQYVIVENVEGDLAFNSSIAGVVRRVSLLCTIGYSGALSQTKTLVTREFGAAFGANHCNTDTFQSGSAALSPFIKGPVGVPVTVDYSADIETGTANITAYCTRNNRVTYKLVTLTKRGGFF